MGMDLDELIIISEIEDELKGKGRGRGNNNG